MVNQAAKQPARIRDLPKRVYADGNKRPPLCGPSVELILPKNFSLDQSLLIDSSSKFLAKCKSLEAAWDDKSLLESLITESHQVLPSRIANYATQLSMQLGYYSPIRRLPPEIITKIFVFIVQEDPISFGDGRLDSYPMLKTLSRVCSLWHNLVVSQPIFWSYMNVNIGHTHLQERSFSGNAQLDLKPGGGIVKELAARGARWKSLKVSLFSNSDMRQLETMLKSGREDTTAGVSPLPVLENLTIYGRTECRVLHDVKLFICCPSLRELHILGVWWPSSMLNAIDVRNLIVLESTKVLLDFPMVDLLKKCPLLQTLTVGSVFDRVGGAPLPECFFHRHLTTLNLYSIDASFPKDVWQSIRLPNLAYLNIVILTMSTASRVVASVKDTLAALRDMLIFSGCSLRETSYQLVEADGIEGSSTDVDYLQAFMESLPTTGGTQQDVGGPALWHYLALYSAER
ncbi:hypothetical protein BDP27DRAFT_1356741 [Rhodocollybia butyracea]|uniref:F-box domain-containing protein n=1 Tax=Rhodocollybia butyracea TaxID=206335 RepID=A0A9P5QB20_9AGAR|nr:hypothetical protein BDP27DRAFT_1356741 [Rhodocollybia butyracea]